MKEPGHACREQNEPRPRLARIPRLEDLVGLERKPHELGGIAIEHNCQITVDSEVVGARPGQVVSGDAVEGEQSHDEEQGKSE